MTDEREPKSGESQRQSDPISEGLNREKDDAYINEQDIASLQYNDEPAAAPLQGMKMLDHLRRLAEHSGRDYGKLERERLPKEIRLRAIGLTIEEVAEVIGYSVGAVGKDSRKHQFTTIERPTPEAQYPLQFRVLAQFLVPTLGATDTDALPSSLQELQQSLTPKELEKLCSVLSRKLAIKEWLDLSTEIGITDELRTDNSQLTGYARLMNKILNLPSKSKSIVLAETTKYFESVLADVQQGKLAPPDSGAALLQEIQLKAYASNVMPLRPSLDANSTQMVDEIVSKRLPPREAQVIRKRFGIGGESRAHTQVELAEDLGIGRSRMPQIESKAIRRLRHRDSSNELRRYLELKFTSEFTGDSNRLDQLQEFGLSDRIYTILRSASIDTIEDLAAYLVATKDSWLYYGIPLSEAENLDCQQSLLRYRLAQIQEK